MEHNVPHTRMVYGQLIYERSGLADYTGILFNGHGSHLAVEAKKRRGDLLKSEVKIRQADHLDAVSRAGGLALLLVRFVEGMDHPRADGFVTEHAVRWTEVPWRIRKSAESVAAEDLAPWRVSPESACYLEPFCPVRGVPPPDLPTRRYPRE